MYCLSVLSLISTKTFGKGVAPDTSEKPIPPWITLISSQYCYSFQSRETEQPHLFTVVSSRLLISRYNRLTTVAKYSLGSASEELVERINSVSEINVVHWRIIDCFQ